MHMDLHLLHFNLRHRHKKYRIKYYYSPEENYIYCPILIKTLVQIIMRKFALFFKPAQINNEVIL